ncbi:hypothetical protein CEXT_333761 [Caerostris extrusa]|uniref:Uncharacterized protein n=1 Tax=Caerostris extrusa TaxID=172846 RepID=A0AAV4TQX0_CAEEX|nr:hypothetical protein CEXT_333761 [Caerostris extrusa]
MAESFYTLIQTSINAPNHNIIFVPFSNDGVIFCQHTNPITNTHSRTLTFSSDYFKSSPSATESSLAHTPPTKTDPKKGKTVFAFRD